MRALRRRRTVVCQQLVEMVTDYLQGELDPARRAAVEEHVAVCGHCRGYVEQVQRLLELTAAPEPQPLPDELLEALLTRYRKRHG